MSHRYVTFVVEKTENTITVDCDKAICVFNIDGSYTLENGTVTWRWKFGESGLLMFSSNDGDSWNNFLSATIDQLKISQIITDWLVEKTILGS